MNVFYEILKLYPNYDVPDHEMAYYYGSCGYGFAFLAISQCLLLLKMDKLNYMFKGINLKTIYISKSRFFLICTHVSTDLTTNTFTLQSSSVIKLIIVA